MLALRTVLLSLAALVAPIHGGASAASWPEKPVRVVVPYAPGGFTDVAARLVGARLSERIGQPVVVENRAGASTMLGAEAVARSAPDGHTLLMATTSTLSTNPLMFRKMPYKASDLQAVALVALTPFVLVAHPSVPASNVTGLVEHARANPGKLDFAMLGPGSSTHLVDEMFRSQAKVDIRDVPYKGSGPASSDLMAGHVQLNFDAVSTAVARIRGGKLKALGITSEERSPLLPEVPTFKESGLPGMVAYSWYGLVAPAGTPRPVVEAINRAVNEVLGMPEVISQLDANGARAPRLDADRFGELIDAHTQTWAGVIKPLNIQLD